MCVGVSVYNAGGEHVEPECREHMNSSTKICNSIPVSPAYGSDFLPSPPDYSYYYKTIGVKLQEVEPEICYIEPEDEYVRDRFWKEDWFEITANSINEWKYNLQQETSIIEGWNWNYRLYLLDQHVDKNIYDKEFRACNVFVFFERMSEEGKLGQTGYYYNNSFYGYTVITIYAESFILGDFQITLGDTPENTTITRAHDDLIELSAQTIGKVAQHEFGHVLGLEHQYLIINAPGSNSIMQAYLDPLTLNEDRFITQDDIDAAVILYGHNGFGGWNNPIKERFIIIP